MASCFGSKTWSELQHPNRSEFSRWVFKYDPTLSRDDDCDFLNVVMIVWGMNSRVTQQCNMSPIFMQLTGQNNSGIASPVFLLDRKCNWLVRTYIINMRNATCVATQTLKVPTRVILLFIFLFRGCDKWNVLEHFAIYVRNVDVQIQMNFDINHIC